MMTMTASTPPVHHHLPLRHVSTPWSKSSFLFFFSLLYSALLSRVSSHLLIPRTTKRTTCCSRRRRRLSRTLNDAQLPDLYLVVCHQKLSGWEMTRHQSLSHHLSPKLTIEETFKTRKTQEEEEPFFFRGGVRFPRYFGTLNSRKHQKKKKKKKKKAKQTRPEPEKWRSRKIPDFL